MMFVTELEQQLEDRDYRLQRLRIEMLRGWGYSLRSALLLASRVDVDFLMAERLSALGCPEETALRILI